MNREDVIKIYNAITKEKGKGNIRFRYYLLKNECVIKSEINILLAIESDIAKIANPFNIERDSLIKELGTFDKDLKTYAIKPDEIKKVNEYTKKYIIMQEKHKDIIILHDNKFIEYQKMLKEDLKKSFKFIEISIEDCPEDLKTENLEVFMKYNIIK